MNPFQHLPPEMLPQMRSMFVSMFGGLDKLDCWLTLTAEQLADAGNPANRPLSLDPAAVPLQYQALMQQPHGVVDLMLEQIDGLGIFGYAARMAKQGGVVTAAVIDRATGHRLETLTGPDRDGLSRSLREKFGPGLEIVEE